MSGSTDTPSLSELVARLRAWYWTEPARDYDPEERHHPHICDEAADVIELLLSRLSGNGGGAGAAPLEVTDEMLVAARDAQASTMRLGDYSASHNKTIRAMVAAALQAASAAAPTTPVDDGAVERVTKALEPFFSSAERAYGEPRKAALAALQATHQS